MASFIGTDTGNSYKVGQSYSMAGDVYVARADGKFENQRTGRATTGSSELIKSAAAASLGASGSGSGPKGPRVATGLNVSTRDGSVTVTGSGGVTVDGKFLGGGPGGGSYTKGGSQGGQITAGSGPGVVKGQGMRLAVDDWLPATPILIGGQVISTHTGWSDGSTMEQRYGEFGGSALGLGVLMADGYLTFKQTYGFNDDKLAHDIATGAADFAMYLGKKRSELAEQKRLENLVDIAVNRSEFSYPAARTGYEYLTPRKSNGSKSLNYSGK